MGGARTFFTVYASIKSEQILDDANALGAVMTAVFTDAIEGMMIAFEEVFMGIQQWNDALMDLAEPIEEARIHFEKFFDDNIDLAEDLEAQIISIGAAFNQSAAESLEAAATMKQLEMQIGGDEAQMGVTTGSMLLGAVGMMETESAMQALMQLQMQTGFMYGNIQKDNLSAEEQRIVVLENTIRLVDRLNEVENTSGATIQNMIQALNQYASAATLVNTSLDEQIALGATLIEQGEQSSKAGRSIKQMLARLASDRSGNNALLAEYNVQVKDEAGNMLTLMQVMEQLKPQWDGLSSSQQTNIAIGVAGAHHYVRFIKLMEGYDRAVQIQTSSQLSANSALEEFGTFQENGMYQIQQYEKHIQDIEYQIAKKLIPTNLQLIKVQYMQADAQNTLMGTGPGKMISQWLLMGSAVYEVMKPLMQFALAITVLGVAQKTLLAQTVAQTHAQKALTTLKGLEATTTVNIAEAEKVLNILRASGVHSDELSLKLLGSQALVNAHNVNLKIQQINLLIKQQKLLMDNTHIMTFHSQSQMDMTEMTFMGLQAELTKQKAEEKGYVTRLAQIERELGMKSDLLTSEMIHASSVAMVDDIEHAGSIQRQTDLRNEITSLNAESTFLNNKIALIRSEGTAKLLSAQSVGVYNKALTEEEKHTFNNLLLKGLVLDTEEQDQMMKINNINLQQLRTDVDQLVTQGVLTQADADKIHTTILGQKVGVTSMLMKGSMLLTNAMMLSSLAVGFMGDETDRAEAQMILMTAAFVPMIAMTFAQTVAMLELGAATAVATGGLTILLALAAAAGAMYASDKYDIFGTSGLNNELDALQEEIDANQAAYEAMRAEYEAFEQSTANQIDTLGDFQSSLEDTKDAMSSFDDKRLEIFFGGRKSAMNNALFNDLKQNGVENLYFSPEIYVTNNFSGVTYEGAAQLVTEAIEERLKDSGALQTMSGY